MTIESIPRGLTESECRKICEAPRRLPADASTFRIWKAERDELLIRMLYEGFPRIGELLKADVTDVDFEEDALYIRHPKGRAVFTIKNGERVYTDTIHKQRSTHFSNYTRDLMIRHFRRRKRGPLITTSRGKRLSVRQAERIVNKYAELAGIQRVIGYTKNGREIRLVTCKALREAGERHTDVAGADRDATARIAGHTVRTKEKYYKRGNFEEDRRIVREHHPLMREELERSQDIEETPESKKKERRRS